MNQRQIGRYIIEAQLGEGGMGLVFKATDPLIQRTVAIKTIRVANLKKESTRKEFMDRFFREARICGGLHHPNIVAVYDIGEHEGEPFIVMEYVEGRPLEFFLEDKQYLTKERVLDLLFQVAAGLETAHEQGIVHRDIKPQNIMISKSGVAKILDFGIAKPADSNMTQTGQFLGTPKYCSPEQVLANPLGPGSDLFSLAVLTHELLTGESPFPGNSANSILFKIVNGEPDIKLNQMPFNIDNKALKSVFEKAFQKDPGARYQKATDFVKALETAFKVEALAEDRVTGPDDKTHMVVHERPFEATALETGLRDPLKALEELEQELEFAKVREERIQAWRAKFQDSLKLENLVDCRRYCKKLEDEKTDVYAEKKQLALLENRLMAKAQEEKQRREVQEKQRRRQIEQKRSELREHLDDRRLERAVDVLEELKALDTQVGQESDLIQKYIEEERKREKERRKQAAIADNLRAFEAALAGEDLNLARDLLGDLGKKQAAEPAHQKALEKLEQTLAKRAEEIKIEAAQLKRLLVRAIEVQDLDEAQRCVRELDRLSVDYQVEAKAFAQFKARLDAEAKKVRDQISGHGKSFSQALLQKDPAKARIQIDHLRRLGLNPAAEEKALEQLQSELHQERIDQIRAEFKAAHKAGDPHLANQRLADLKDLGQDVSQEKRAIAQLESQILARAQRDKNKLIKKHNQAFKKALKNQRRDLAEQALSDLVKLGAETQDLRRQLPEMGKPKPTAPTSPAKRSLPPWLIAAILGGIAVVILLIAISRRTPAPSNRAKLEELDPRSADMLQNPTANLDAGKPNPDNPGAKPPIGSNDRDSRGTFPPDQETNSANSLDSSPGKTSPESLRPKTASDVAVAEPENPKTQPGSSNPTREQNASRSQEKNTPSQALKDRKPAPASEDQPKFQSLKDAESASALNDRKKPGANDPAANGASKIRNEPAQTPGKDQSQTDRIGQNQTQGSSSEVLNEPQPVQKINLPELRRAFQHENRRSVNLTGKNLEIDFSLEGIIGNQIGDVLLVWRRGSEPYIKQKMGAKGGKYLTEIPSNSLKRGVIEYYFSVKLGDGSEVLLMDKNEKPFTSKLKTPGAFGF